MRCLLQVLKKNTKLYWERTAKRNDKLPTVSLYKDILFTKMAVIYLNFIERKHMNFNKISIGYYSMQCTVLINSLAPRKFEIFKLISMGECKKDVTPVH